MIGSKISDYIVFLTPWWMKKNCCAILLFSTLGWHSIGMWRWICRTCSNEWLAEHRNTSAWFETDALTSTFFFQEPPLYFLVLHCHIIAVFATGQSYIYFPQKITINWTREGVVRFLRKKHQEMSFYYCYPIQIRVLLEEINQNIDVWKTQRHL